MRILIIKLGAKGDVLRTTSILKGLKEKYRNPFIYWLTKADVYPLLKNNQLIDKILLLGKDTIDNIQYDLIINLDDEEEACRLVSKLKKTKLFGAYIKDGKKEYTDDSAEWFDMSLISKFGKEKADELKKKNKATYQDIICKALGIMKNKIILNLDNSNIEFANSFKKKNNIKGLVIGLNTSAGRRWQLKKLDTEKTIKLANLLQKKFNAKVILFGGPEEAERNKEIKAKANVIDAGTNNPLLDFAALVNICDIVIASDSLAAHIAIDLGKKVIIFFGPTSAEEIDVYNKGRKIVPDIGCLYCYKKVCDFDPNCMDKIKVDDFIKAVEELLK